MMTRGPTCDRARCLSHHPGMRGEDVIAVFLTVVAEALGSALALLFTMPFFVSITRLRANYLPKAVSLNNVLNEGEQASMENRTLLHSLFMRTRRATAKIGPVVDGVIPMIWRTKRIEGWRGLYQGSTVLMTWTLGVLILTTIPWFGEQNNESWLLNLTFFNSILMELVQSLLVLPFDVVLKRTMVHPRRLNWFAPRQSMKEVLSASEYKQPWRLFMLPGLLQAVLLRVAFVSTLANGAQFLLLSPPRPILPSDPKRDEFEGPSSSSTRVTVLGFAAYLMIVLLLQLLAVPFECIVVRLATQRPVAQQPLHVAYAHNAPAEGPAPHNHQATVASQASADAPPNPEPEAEADGHGDTDEGASPMDEEAAQPLVDGAMPQARVHPPRTKSPTSEPVIALRPCDEALDEMDSYYGAAPVERYTGVADCFRKMVAEEGYESLYRGLPFSTCFVFLSTLSLIPLFMDAFSLFS